MDTLDSLESPRKVNLKVATFGKSLRRQRQSKADSLNRSQPFLEPESYGCFVHLVKSESTNKFLYFFQLHNNLQEESTTTLHCQFVIEFHRLLNAIKTAANRIEHIISPSSCLLCS